MAGALPLAKCKNFGEKVGVWKGVGCGLIAALAGNAVLGSHFGCPKRVKGAKLRLSLDPSPYPDTTEAADRGGGEKPIMLTNLRRFCAIAASGHSSRAPVMPRSRRRRKLRWCFRCANNISTLRRSRADFLNASVPARLATCWRTSSCALTDSTRDEALVHCGLSAQPAQSRTRAR